MHSLDFVENVARICHETNRAFCITIGDTSQPSWDEAADWQKSSCKAGVHIGLQTDLSPEQYHQLWLDNKTKDGWIFGTEKNVEKKTHPCMVPYDSLAPEHRIKDELFRAIVNVFKGYTDAKEG